MRRIAVFTLILLLIAGGAYAAEQGDVIGQAIKAEVVGNEICPVSGEKIDEKMKQTYEYKGKIYNFCCPVCIEEFKKDPEKYLRKLEKTEEGRHEHEHGEHDHH